MKKKVLLSVVSLMAMFGMASCGGNSGSVTPSSQTSASEAVTLTSLAISNKTAFADLHALDANVKLELAISPAGNIASLVNSGVISITSSNTAVGIVNGLYFSPVGAGETTITVTSGSLSDTVTVTVAAKAETPVVTDFAQLTELNSTYTVKGVVAATNTKGFVLSNGTQAVYVHMNTTPSFEIGDYVSVTSKLTNYNGQIQFAGNDASAVVKKITGTAPVASDAVELTKEIADGFATKTYAITDTKKYKWSTLIGTSDSGYTVTPFAGSDTTIEPVYVDSSKFTLEKGKNYDIEGYFLGFNTEHSYAVIMVTKAEIKAESATGLALSAPMTEVAQGSTMKISPVYTPSTATDELTWTSSYDKVTVADGLVTVAYDAVVGTEVTITATSKVTPSITAECKFIIKAGLTEAEKYGTADAPITVARALATMAEDMPNANDTITDHKIYVKGIAKSVSFISNYSSYTTYLVDSLDDTNSLQVYSGNLATGVAAPAQNDVVTANGYAKNYNGTLEICGVNNVYPEFTEVVRGTSKITVNAPEGVTVTGLGETAVNGSTASFTVAVPEGKKVDTVKLGTETLTAADDGSYSFTVSGDAAIKITIKDADAPEEVVLYSTGFESSEGFTASTSYNNTTQKLIGTAPKQWATIEGDATLTDPLEGKQSVQIRYYSKNAAINPALYMNFDVENVSEIEFTYLTKVATDGITVHYSTDSGANWVKIEDVNGTTKKAEYTHSFDAPVATFRLKVEFSTHAADKNYAYVDSVVLK